jgi:hypothetical protein
MQIYEISEFHFAVFNEKSGSIYIPIMIRLKFFTFEIHFNFNAGLINKKAAGFIVQPYIHIYNIEF